MSIEAIAWNIIWDLSKFLIKLPYELYKIAKISKFLLTENRNTRGNGCGTHLADRFIDIWKERAGLNFTYTDYQDACHTQSRWPVDIIDQKLEKAGMIVIKGNKSYPIQNMRHKLIIKFLKFCLVHIFGDNRSEYSF